MENQKKRKLIILGCTGSIGTTALEALQSLSHSFEIVGLSAHSSLERLLSIAQQWNCKTLCISQDSPDYSTFDGITLYTGREGLLSMIRQTQADIILNGIAGSSGLEPTFAAIESNKDVALANKESIVMAGEILFKYAQEHGVQIIPVDSEHSTIHALIEAHGKKSIESLIITASGGPFRTFIPDQMEHITVEMAVAHPTWQMGTKISIDSATLANKGLEVIEASYLFGFPPNTIEVVIHPQSIVHSMVRLHNGAVYAQMSPPDMALPIMSAISNESCALHHTVKPLDFSQLTLQFSSPDFSRFPLLRSAFDVVQKKGSYAIAYNAANEIAVQAFVDGRIAFMDIATLVAHILHMDWSQNYTTLEEVLAIDRYVRQVTQQVVLEWPL